MLAQLRAEGFDIASVRDLCRGARDSDVLALARNERRVLLTEDKDFGELSLHAERSPGVVLFRDLGASVSESMQAFRSLVAHHADDLEHSFVVIRGTRIRRRHVSG